MNCFVAEAIKALGGKVQIHYADLHPGEMVQPGSHWATPEDAKAGQALYGLCPESREFDEATVPMLVHTARPMKFVSMSLIVGKEKK